MTAKRFRSKVDWWIALLLIATMLILLVTLGSFAYQNTNELQALAVVGGTLTLVALILWMTVGTYYSVDGNTLKIAAGPIRWKVPIDEISSVEQTHSPISSPALSLDRLRIRYSGKKSVMISPADKKRFMKALGLDLSNGITPRNR